MSKPIITPGDFLGRDAAPAELEGCWSAVVAFCPFYDMKHKLSAEPLSESLFSHLGESQQYLGHAGSRMVLGLERVYGGPVSATVIEELAHYGIKEVVGYGYAGSLTRDVPVGQMVFADGAFVSDGASREYSPDDGLVYPDRELADRVRRCATERGVTLHAAKVWTTDALYREYPDKIAEWRAIGGEVVNMDTSHFYAVSRTVGISAAYSCVISDCVEGPKWDDGFDRVVSAMGDLQDLVLEVLAGTERVSGSLA